jgi:hypothetical protein
LRVGEVAPAVFAHSLLALALQFGPPGGPGGPGGVEVDVGTGLGGGAVGAFFTTLIVGGILVAVLPEYTEARMTDLVETPVGSFVYGLVCLVLLVLATFVLAVTIVGILVAVPLAILAGLVWAVGAAIGFLAIADRIVGRADGWAKPLLVASLLNGGAALTGVGGLVSFAVGAAGFGAVLRNYLE